MEVKPENVIVNSCEYTPVYLIPSPGVTQTGSYIFAPNNQETAKPVSDNLKRFYENSGNLANGIVSSPKPRILKRATCGTIGNNLKLASFLLPKSEPSIFKKEVAQAQAVPAAGSIILRPMSQASAVTTNVVTTVTTVPRVEVDRKIVRVHPKQLQQRNNGRPLPKIMPKERIPQILQQRNSSKHTSVQLLKLGETYHSLNQLSDEQMKIVNHALKMFSDGSETTPKEPAYDPVTNTKFIYKVVSPRDLTVVGKKAFALKPKKAEVCINRRPIIKKIDRRVESEDEEEAYEASSEIPVVTRSGRTVKLPKQICPEEADIPTKAKRKVGNVISCYQCSSEFSSLYRLQRHYEMYPTHIPAKIHSNLFHCLLAIIKSGSDGDQASIFLQQLQQLIDKLKALLPCLLKEYNEEAKQCYINGDIGRVFGLDPGKYYLNMEALNCVKDKDGYCAHNPPSPNSAAVDPNRNQPTSNDVTEINTEDCARINSIDKWPAVSKRIRKMRQQKSDSLKAKRMRLESENNEQNIELGTDDFEIIEPQTEEDSAIRLENRSLPIIDIHNDTIDKDTPTDDTTSTEQSKPTKSHVKFHSAHFDIRSSPIKSSSQLVKKFQINSKTLPNFEVQIMRPSTPETTSDTSDNISMQTASDSLQRLFSDNIEKDLNVDLNFDNSKDWQLTDSNSVGVGQHDSFILPSLTPIKEANVIEPSLIHKVNQPEDFLQCTKSINLETPTKSLIEHLNGKTNDVFETPNGTIESALLQNDPKDMIEQSLMQEKPNGSNGLYHKPDSLLEQGFVQEKADFFEQEFLLGKSNGLFEESPIRVKSESSLVDPSFMHSKNGMYEALAHVKQRSHSLFSSQDSLIGRNGLSMKGEPTFLDTLHSNCDSLIEQMGAKSSLEQSFIGDKCQESIDQNDSNQGQSVLNFLESLGNELAYPETDIRNSSVDFQLDLFTFNSS